MIRKLLAPLALFFLLLTACKEGAGPDFLGKWTLAYDAQDVSSSKRSEATLIFSEGGSFSAIDIPRGIACPESSETTVIGGEGGWDYDKEGGRILLSFKTLSDVNCEPFLNALPVELTVSGYAIEYYPKGVDGSVVEKFYKNN